MLSFSKSFFQKKSTKISRFKDDEFVYTGIGGNSADKSKYVEKVFVSNLTFEQMENVYLADVWVRACVDRIVDRVCDVQPVFRPIKSYIDDGVGDKKYQLKDETLKNIDKLNEFIIEPNNNYESFTDIRKKAVRDLLRYDAAGIEIVTGISTDKEKPAIIEIYNVSGNLIKPNPDKRGIFSEKDAYKQVDDSNGSVVATWGIDKFMYFMLNPKAGSVYGISPIESLSRTVEADLDASDYNLKFFNNNATPRFAVLMKNMGLGQGSTAMKRFRSWWNEEMEGNPHKPIILGTEQGDIDFKSISVTNEEMQFSQYSLWLLMKILVVYKMQPSILGIGIKESNPGDIKDQLDQFKKDAIKPVITVLADKFNRHIVRSGKLFNIKDVYMDFDLEIGDKEILSKYHEIYLRTGVITINQIRNVLGMIPVYWGDVPYMQNNVAPFGRSDKKDEQAVPGEFDNQSDAPNIITDSKSHLKNFIEQGNGDPVGWEDLEVNERIETLMKLLRLKEKELNKIYVSSIN